MNEIAGVKDKILDCAKEIATQDGIAKINIRLVAAKCGIAVGTVYNHFPDKGDLIATVIEDFWMGVFSDMDYQRLATLDAVPALEALYFELLTRLSNFKVNWLEQLSLLSISEKQRGRAKEQQMYQRIIDFVEKIIIKDEQVRAEYDSKETAQLALLLFDNMIAMLKRGETDFSFAKHLLQKVLS